tara:strand:- start:454 stop:918 length:465 start_codon:yes stop_codon:yes gene_type:complete
MKFFKNQQEVKKVIKPWGHELWLASEATNSFYAFKEIFIKSGYKTSFQFHSKKFETNYIISGLGELHISNSVIDEKKFINNLYEPQELEELINNLNVFTLKPGCVFNVSPGFVHSVFSKNDLVMCETSTLHLDDVYRINDEYGRNHGRIDSEHA